MPNTRCLMLHCCRLPCVHTPCAAAKQYIANYVKQYKRNPTQLEVNAAAPALLLAINVNHTAWAQQQARS